MTSWQDNKTPDQRPLMRDHETLNAAQLWFYSFYRLTCGNSTNVNDCYLLRKVFNCKCLYTEPESFSDWNCHWLFNWALFPRAVGLHQIKDVSVNMSLSLSLSLSLTYTLTQQMQVNSFKSTFLKCCSSYFYANEPCTKDHAFCMTILLWSLEWSVITDSTVNPWVQLPDWQCAGASVSVGKGLHVLIFFT